MNVQDGLLYTKEHEWVKVEGDSAKIGITDYAQASLGDITFVELPKVGDNLVQTKGFATVESIKAASDVYAPLSGEVVKINEGLNNNPAAVNQSPYTDGWFVIIKIQDRLQTGKLLSAADYKKHLETLSK
ncbi:glycine cleavage system protein GcvH [bacterium]|nr:MAG: glycine cleavage system protein GcvH [bacterium]